MKLTLEKKGLLMSGEVTFGDGAAITGLSASDNKVYCISGKSVVRSVADNGSIQNAEVFMNGHSEAICSIVFPSNFGEIFATACND